MLLQQGHQLPLKLPLQQLRAVTLTELAPLLAPASSLIQHSQILLLPQLGPLLLLLLPQLLLLQAPAVVKAMGQIWSLHHQQMHSRLGLVLLMQLPQRMQAHLHSPLCLAAFISKLPHQLQLEQHQHLSGTPHSSKQALSLALPEPNKLQKKRPCSSLPQLPKELLKLVLLLQQQLLQQQQQQQPAVTHLSLALPAQLPLSLLLQQLRLLCLAHHAHLHSPLLLPQLRRSQDSHASPEQQQASRHLHQQPLGLHLLVLPFPLHLHRSQWLHTLQSTINILPDTVVVVSMETLHKLHLSPRSDILVLESTLMGLAMACLLPLRQRKVVQGLLWLGLKAEALRNR